MSNAPRLILSAAVALSLAGCSLGPRYAAPGTPTTAAGPFVSSAPAATSAEAAPDQWWRLYQDPVLDRLVQQALIENKDLKVAAANLAYAQALAGEARAGLFPTTNLSAGDTYGKSATANLLAALAGRKATPEWSSSAGVTAAYQLDLFARVRGAITAARANAQAVQAAEDAVRVTVAAETTAAYVNACAYADQADVARQSVALIQQTYDITVKERQAGSATDLDVDRQGALLQQTAASPDPGGPPTRGPV